MVALLLVGYTSYQNTIQFIQKDAADDRINSINQRLNNIISTAANAETGQGGYMITNTIDYLQSSDSALRDIHSHTFRSYLRQLLYYLVMTGVEKGILCIRYNVKSLTWVKRDADGDHFIRKKDAKDVDIESWGVYLASDDVIREVIKNEMARRKNLFLKALEENDVSILPRLVGESKRIKCFHCPFFQKCMNQDSETLEAKELAQEVDLLDMGNVVDVLDATPA
jgi:hypothetical protein